MRKTTREICLRRYDGLACIKIRLLSSRDAQCPMTAEDIGNATEDRKEHSRGKDICRSDPGLEVKSVESRRYMRLCSCYDGIIKCFYSRRVVFSSDS